MARLHERQVFLRWLKKQNLFEQYCHNFLQYRIHPINRLGLTNSLKFENITPNNFIMYGFHWYSTKEGSEFWRNIHRKWELYCQFKNVF